jgi:Metallo-beta-lactamase superfamily
MWVKLERAWKPSHDHEPKNDRRPAENSGKRDLHLDHTPFPRLGISWQSDSADAASDSAVQNHDSVDNASRRHGRHRRWGFAALVDVDGHRMLVDTGAHPDAVIRNAHDPDVHLSDVQEVILTHYHWDHVGGLFSSNDVSRTIDHILRWRRRRRPGLRATAGSGPRAWTS